jgi:hypothetical protein
LISILLEKLIVTTVVGYAAIRQDARPRPTSLFSDDSYQHQSVLEELDFVIVSML